ncbi:acetyltransferase [bacterium SCSIO 12741]|nr:acetyltransferase [bacterium SCSIO 12741]
MNSKLSFRMATSADIDLLRHWDNQPHVIASDPNDDWDWAKELKQVYIWREQWIAEWDGQPLGFLQIIDPKREETHYWGDVEDNLKALDIWIGEANNLGKGYGTWMMLWAIQRCFEEEGAKAILLDPLESNKKAHKFYERLGFVHIENRVFDQDYCRVYRLNNPSL